MTDHPKRPRDPNYRPYLTAVDTIFGFEKEGSGLV